MIGNIAGPGTIDTISTTGCHTFPPTAIGGTPIISATVRVNKTALQYYPSNAPVNLTDINGTLTGIVPPCPPVFLLARKLITPYQNKTVFIEKKLVAVEGDAVTAPPAVNTGGIPTPKGVEPGTYALNDRPLTILGQHSNILIGVKTAIANIPNT